MLPANKVSRQSMYGGSGGSVKPGPPGMRGWEGLFPHP